MEFLYLHCQLKWSISKRKDSLNFLTQVKSSVLFIEMKKVCSALFHLELWDTTVQQALMLCSTFLGISLHVFLLYIEKPFSVMLVKEKNKFGKCLLHDSLLLWWMSSTHSVSSTPLPFLVQKVMVPSTIAGAKCIQKKKDLPKDICEGGQLRGRIYLPWNQPFSFLTSAYP